MSTITIDYIIAEDDSCQLQFYARGHHDPWAFLAAVTDYAIREGRDVALPVEPSAVRQIHWRKVPTHDQYVISQRMHETAPGRGAFAVTLLDAWFPLHKYARRAASSPVDVARIEPTPHGYQTADEIAEEQR